MDTRLEVVLPDKTLNCLNLKASDSAGGGHDA